MMISAVVIMLLAGAAQAREVPAQEVTIEVMTCAQLKAEGERQLAIMKDARYNDFEADLADDADMTRLGELQGKRSVALGALQAVTGLAGNATAVGQVGEIHDKMNKADKVERDAILKRGHARYQANEKVENRAGEHFMALTEQYRRRGCGG